MFPVDDLTIVIPTFNERDNVTRLIGDINSVLLVLPELSIRLLFIDDSPNNATVEVIEIAAVEQSGPRLTIDYVHRREDDRDGLAGAVIYGIRRTATDLVMVMDGDGQHPPRTIPSMLAAIEPRDMDLVVASRYCPGGSAEGLSSPVRHVVSRMSTWVAKGMFPRATRGITDPMTGFFVVRAQSINLDSLESAAGFKVLLELMVQHPRLGKTQVPLQFAARHDGVSKGTLTQGWLYLRQLFRLRFTALSIRESR